MEGTKKFHPRPMGSIWVVKNRIVCQCHHPLRDHTEGHFSSSSSSFPSFLFDDDALPAGPNRSSSGNVSLLFYYTSYRAIVSLTLILPALHNNFTAPTNPFRGWPAGTLGHTSISFAIFQHQQKTRDLFFVLFNFISIVQCREMILNWNVDDPFKNENVL